MRNEQQSFHHRSPESPRHVIARFLKITDSFHLKISSQPQRREEEEEEEKQETNNWDRWRWWRWRWWQGSYLAGQTQQQTVIFSSHREIQCVHRQGCWYFTRWWSHWLRRHSEREATTLPKNHSSLSESKASFFYPSVIPVNYDDGGFAFSPSFHACPSGDKKLDEYRERG